MSLPPIPRIALFSAAFALAAMASASAWARARGETVTVISPGNVPLAKDIADKINDEGLTADVPPPVTTGGGLLPRRSNRPKRAPRRDISSPSSSIIRRAESAGRLRGKVRSIARSSRWDSGAVRASPGDRRGRRCRQSEGAGARRVPAFGAAQRRRAARPGDFPPEVTAVFEEAKKVALSEPPRPVAIELVPPWAVAWIDGQRAGSGDRVSLAPGAHYAYAEAAGFTAFAGGASFEADNPKISVRLTGLEPEARRASVRAAATTLNPATPGVADELTAAFGGVVLVIAPAKAGTAPEGISLMPPDPETERPRRSVDAGARPPHKIPRGSSPPASSLGSGRPFRSMPPSARSPRRPAAAEAAETAATPPPTSQRARSSACWPSVGPPSRRASRNHRPAPNPAPSSSSL